MTHKTSKPVALLDLDGTLVDFDGQMAVDLAQLAAPGEDFPISGPGHERPPHIEARRRLIKQQPGWWYRLPWTPWGPTLVQMLTQLGFRLHVLTKGPHNTTSAWTEKVQWVRDNLPDAEVTITEDKGLVYGKVLVDDWPGYIQRWLEWRPRGLVIMPAHPYNEGFEHPNVIRYDGSDEIRAQVAVRLRVLTKTED